MSTAALNVGGSSLSRSWPKFYPDDLFEKWDNTTAFRVASLLTDPVCKAHELYRRISIVAHREPSAGKISHFAQKFFLLLGAVGFALLSLFTTLPGIAVRYLALKWQQHPYLYMEGDAEEKNLTTDRTFSLLSWNVCGPSAGYVITDGGVLPWSFRFEQILGEVTQTDADVTCLYEVNDVEMGYQLAKRLKSNGYRHFYYNMGAKAVGVSSGIFVASKFKVENAEFTPYPLASLVGRTKNCGKGVFSFDLKSGEDIFARIFSSHLQHSEIPSKPDKEKEVPAREVQMQFILKKIGSLGDRCVVVTGDLNLDSDEYDASSWKGRFSKETNFEGRKTWGGDAFCAGLVSKIPSSACDLDYTLLLTNTAKEIHTTLVETGFDGAKFQDNALSDHAGLFSKITLWEPPPPPVPAQKHVGIGKEMLFESFNQYL